MLDIFLEREESWVSVSRAAVADVEYNRAGAVDAHTEARRQAFDKAVAGDLATAVQLLRCGIDTLTDDRESGWAMEELAGYQHHIDPAGSQKTLVAARVRNPGALKAEVPPEPRRTKGPAQQAEAAAAYLAAQYDDPVALRLGVGSLFDNIVWAVPETHDLAEEQFRLLGLHLGFSSSRPDQEENNGGPDNLWGLSPEANAVIELKTEITRKDPVIQKLDEAGQLLTSLEWDAIRNPAATTRIPVLVHPSAVLSRNASLPPHTRVITEHDLANLRADVENFVKDLVAAGRWSDPTTVRDALVRNQLTAATVISTHSTAISTS